MPVFVCFKILTYLLISYLNLLKNVKFNFYDFWICQFSYSYQFLIPCHHDENVLNSVKTCIVAQPKLSWRRFCAHSRKAGVLCMYVSLIWSKVYFKLSASLLIFCLADSSMVETGVLGSSAAVLVSLSLYRLAHVCFRNFGPVTLGACIFTVVLSPWWIYSFVSIWLSWSLLILVKVYFIWNKHKCLCCLFCFHLHILTLGFTFHMWMALKWIPCRKKMTRPFLMNSASAPPPPFLHPFVTPETEPRTLCMLSKCSVTTEL